MPLLEECHFEHRVVGMQEPLETFGVGDAVDVEGEFAAVGRVVVFVLGGEGDAFFWISDAFAHFVRAVI